MINENTDTVRGSKTIPSGVVEVPFEKEIDDFFDQYKPKPPQNKGASFAQAEKMAQEVPIIKEPEALPVKSAEKEAPPKEENIFPDQDKKKTQKSSFIDDLKKEKEQLQRKVKEYEEEKLPSYEKKVKEYEDKISNGEVVTKKEVENLEIKLREIQDQKDRRELELIEEMRVLEKNIEFHDLLNSPQFKNTYDVPIKKNYDQIFSIIGSSQELQPEVTNILIAHNNYLQASDENSRMQALQTRDQLEATLFDQLHPSKQYRFNAALQNLYTKAEDRSEAIKNHNVVKANFEKTAQEERIKRKQFWKDTYDKTAKEIVINYPDEIEKIIRSKGLDDSTDLDEVIARDAIEDGASNHPPHELTRIIRQGSLYKKLNAHIKAQEVRIKELQESMTAIKRTDPSGSSSPTEITLESPKEEKKTDWMDALSRYERV